MSFQKESKIIIETFEWVPEPKEPSIDPRLVSYHRFISKFVRTHGVLSFQSKHICLAIYGPQCQSPMSHLRVRMNKAELKKYQLGASWRCFPICVGLQNKCICFGKNFCLWLLAKSKDKDELNKNAWLLAKLQPFFVDVTIVVLTYP